MTVALWVVATPGTEALRRGLLPLTAACSLLLVVGALLPTGPVAAIARLGRCAGSAGSATPCTSSTGR